MTWSRRQIPVWTMDALHVFTPDQVAAQADECAYHLETHGCLVIGGALPAKLCSILTEFVDDSLNDAECEVAEAADEDSDLAAEKEIQHFGSVRCRVNRRDFKLPMSPLVQEAVECLVQASWEVLEQRVSAEGRLVELSCLVSDPCAKRQSLHPDTPCDERSCAPLITCFVALQPITAEMGPTILCPGTHTPAAHSSFYSETPEQQGSDELVERYGGLLATCDMGTAVLMDSRLLHCGGANSALCHGGARRRLLYATWQLPGNTPGGSTYTIRSELKGRHRLAHFSKRRRT